MIASSNSLARPTYARVRCLCSTDTPHVGVGEYEANKILVKSRVDYNHILTALIDHRCGDDHFDCYHPTTEPMRRGSNFDYGHFASRLAGRNDLRQIAHVCAWPYGVPTELACALPARRNCADHCRIASGIRQRSEKSSRGRTHCSRIRSSLMSWAEAQFGRAVVWVLVSVDVHYSRSPELIDHF